MTDRFHQRFNIQINIEEAHRRFLNRIQSAIYGEFINNTLPNTEDIRRLALFHLGETYQYGRSLAEYVGRDFHENLRLVEAIYESVQVRWRGRLDRLINDSLTLSEVDLEVRWEAGQFIQSGAELLDEQLVNQPLRWLSDLKYKDVLKPFQKALNHFLNSHKNPELRADVVTDLYEALESLAKKVTGKDRDLSANRQLFLKKVNASEDYKRILKEYIDFACKFRHAPGDQRPKPDLSEKETESFIYLTGVFIRLAMN